MARRQFRGWLKYRIEEFRNMKLKVDEGLNIQLILHDKHTELTKKYWRDICFLLNKRC